ncbi:hypothetical protein IWW34DRAFT_105874 [Fusarium oxysporum f. sp. albedinis]|nr:hypothetical protein IWW34DRAFT_105874 [Fusarium oxysporum f. sp. albedinis]KAK2469008.1 hypothetical protein H9L39_19402 [Fusarium oxysporum f. sp. albedinis]
MVTWLSARAFTILGGGVMAYPQVRETTRLIHQDSRSAYAWVTGRLASLPDNSSPQGSTTMWILGSHMSRAQTLFSAAGIVVEAYKAYQAGQIAKELKGIADKITISNNIQVQGSGGPDGFTAHV